MERSRVPERWDPAPTKEATVGTEKFNYIKPAVAHGDKVVLQYALGGDPVTGKVRADAAHGNTNENIKPAGLFSTAPYRPEGVHARPPDRVKRCLADNDTCNGWATTTGYCSGHRKLAG
jgi:hypothetical protein